MLNLWIVIVLLEALLCLWLWLLRQDRVYPAFTYYISFQVAQAVALLFLRQSPAAYFYTYWMCAAADVALKLAIVAELFRSVYRADLVERQEVLRFYMLLTVITLLSFALAFRFPSQYPVRVMAVIRTAELGSDLTLCVAFAVLVVGAWWEGLYWLNRARGIGYGLMLYMPLKLILAVLSHSAWKRTVAVLNWFELSAYMGAVLIWTTFFVRPEVIRVPVTAGELWNRMRAFERSNVAKAGR